MGDKTVEPARSEWDIKDDVRALKRTIAIFKDKDRLADAKKQFNEKKEVEASMESLLDGDMKTALGL